MGLAATRRCAGAVDQAPVIPASIRWRVAQIPPMFGRRGATPRAVAAGEGTFVAVGIVLDGGRVLGRARRTRDGRAWTVVRLPGESRARPASVTLSGDRYVAVGVVEAPGAPRAAAWLSHDGRSWRRAADGPAFDIGGYVDTMEHHGWAGPRDVTADATEELRALGFTCTPAPEEDGGQACRPMLRQSPDAAASRRL